MEDKKMVRQQIREKLKKLSTEYMQESDEKIQEIILELPEFKRAETVFCYISVGKEVSTEKILEECFRQGKLWVFRYVPNRVSWKSGKSRGWNSWKMEFMDCWNRKKILFLSGKKKFSWG